MQQALDPRVERYLKRISLPTKKEGESQKAALERAHELRKFEIENYWKRSSYFWGFQVISFGALALTAKDGRFYPPVVLIVSVLGALAALTGVLTARGSKFWQSNWEAHVDLLETEVEGNLHKTALIEGRNVSFSVSRVNERLLEILMTAWIAAFIVASTTLVFPHLLELDYMTASAIQILLSLTAFLIGAGYLIIGQKSKLRGRAYLLQTMEEWQK